jgi:hypothetical protein
LPPPPGKAEDQNDIGLIRKQLRQIVIDGRIGRRKDMDAAVETGERRPPPPLKRLRDRRTRIERRARERAEAGEENTLGAKVSAVRR